MFEDSRGDIWIGVLDYYAVYRWTAALSSRAEAVAFSACGCDEVGLDRLSRVLSERAAETEELILNNRTG